MERANRLKAYIKEHIGEMETLPLSSNTIYRLRLEGAQYIVKQARLQPEALSPFWYGLFHVFGSGFDTQRRNIAALVAKLKTNPHVAVPDVVCTDDALQYQVFEEVDGLPYEPDAFPAEATVLHQLGQYVGFLHSEAYEHFGRYPDPDRRRERFVPLLLETMQTIIDQYWPADHGVRQYFDRLCAMDFPIGTFSLIMPDISANQFIFTPDGKTLRAVVDLDAYVVGPREWELVILEMCMADGAAFRAGYETCGPLPDLSGWRALYRFFAYLCDPWEQTPLRAFMDSPTPLAPVD